MRISPDRFQSHLVGYFKKIPRNERHGVKYFVCNMWPPHIDLAKAFFPNAKIIIHCIN